MSLEEFMCDVLDSVHEKINYVIWKQTREKEQTRKQMQRQEWYCEQISKNIDPMPIDCYFKIDKLQTLISNILKKIDEELSVSYQDRHSYIIFHNTIFNGMIPYIYFLINRATYRHTTNNLSKNNQWKTKKYFNDNLNGCRQIIFCNINEISDEGKIVITENFSILLNNYAFERKYDELCNYDYNIAKLYLYKKLISIFDKWIHVHTSSIRLKEYIGRIAIAFGEENFEHIIGTRMSVYFNRFMSNIDSLLPERNLSIYDIISVVDSIILEWSRMCICENQNDYMCIYDKCEKCCEEKDCVKHGLLSTNVHNDTSNVVVVNVVNEPISGNIFGKRVLFVDFETTGLDCRTDRIVQVQWCYFDKFSEDFSINGDNVRSIYRRPVDFKIDNNSEAVVKNHRITHDIATQNGQTIEDILDGDFGQCLLNCDVLVSYNTDFSFLMLKNETIRLRNKNFYDKLLQIEKNNGVVCAMKIASKYFKVTSIKLKPAYERIFGENSVIDSDAKSNVVTMLRILKYIIDNIKNESIVNNTNILNKYNELFNTTKQSYYFIGRRNNDEQPSARRCAD